MSRAEARLRGEIHAIRSQRLASDPEKWFNEEDDFGQELAKTFGPHIAFEHRRVDFATPPAGQKPWEPNPDAYEAMARRVEERKPGWPRILHAFWRMNAFEGRSLARDEEYYGHLQVACGHYLSRMGTYGVLQTLLRAEHRAMALAEEDREKFLKAWKNRPVER